MKTKTKLTLKDAFDVIFYLAVIAVCVTIVANFSLSTIAVTVAAMFLTSFFR